LESIAASFAGVAKAFALQAGRDPYHRESSKVSDEQSYWLAKDIARKSKRPAIPVDQGDRDSRDTRSRLREIRQARRQPPWRTRPPASAIAEKA
jgi:hypothetical protein